MASPGGTSSGSSLLHNLASEEDLQTLMEQKKRKRMISNRESARRSRMRKQKLLSDLITELSLLKKENSQLTMLLSITTQRSAAMEAENSILMTQVKELNHALESLNEIAHNMRGSNLSSNMRMWDGPQLLDSSTSLWNLRHINQPIMVSAENVLYY